MLRFRSIRCTLSAVVALAVALAGFAAAQPDGADIFAANCAGCHQSNGQGLTGAFPPLAGVVPRIALAENGRATLIHIVLFGMQGEITIDGATYNGSMPAWGSSLSDEEIAAVINHELTAWDNATMLPEDFELIQASEVEAERSASLTPTQVHEAFLALDLGETAAEGGSTSGGSSPDGSGGGAASY